MSIFSLLFNWIAANDDENVRSSSSSSFLLFHWVHTTAAATALRHQHKNHRIAPSFISLRKERRSSSSSSMVVEKKWREKNTRRQEIRSVRKSMPNLRDSHFYLYLSWLLLSRRSFWVFKATVNHHHFVLCRASESLRLILASDRMLMKFNE